MGDFVEFMVVYTIMAGGTDKEVLAKLFRLFDVNSDGFISMKEMKRLVKDMYGLLKKDPNIGAADLIAKSAFAEMDKDEDGKISLDEFTTAVLGEKDFSKLLSTTALDIFMEEEKTD